MTRYWIAVASREHVLKGVASGFAQVCHGKGGPLKRMSEGDWIIYYSPTERFGEAEPCRMFTAIGKITVDEPYTYAMSSDFIPWRRNVAFVQSKDAQIKPLLHKLSFITDVQRWGFPFRRGCFEITEADFRVIKHAMGAADND